MTTNTIPGWVPPVPSAGTVNGQSDLKTIRATVVAGDKPIPVVYGKQQVGGQVFAATFAGGFWYVGALLCVGEIEAVDQVYLNEAAPVSGVTVNTYTGTTSQTADALLSAAISGYSDTLVMSHPAGDIGLAYVVLQYTNDHYAGFPSIIAEVRGRKLFDPDTSTTAYSNNPGLALRDFIADARYGLGASINDTSVIDVADACSATVSTEARRELGLVIDAAQEAERWVETLAMYAGCWAFRRGAEWVLAKDRPGSSVATFNETNIVRDSLKISVADRSQTPTVVEVSYTDTNPTIWRQREVEIALAGVSTGAVPRRVSRVNMTGVSRYSQAYRETSERLGKLQRGISVEFVAFDNHTGVEAGDLITLSHGYGITSQLFRVARQPRLVSPGRALIAGHWHDAADYDDSENADPAYGDSDSRVGSDPSTDDLLGGGDQVTTVWFNGIEGADYDAWTADTGHTKALETVDVFSGTRSMRITTTTVDTDASGSVGGVWAHVPEDIALFFGGRRVEVIVHAKTDDGCSQFQVGYSTNDTGNSGWQTFTPTSSWAQYSFFYDVPAPSAGGDDFIGIQGYTDGSVLVDHISIIPVQYVTAANIDKYFAALAIGNAYIVTLDAGKVTTGLLSAQRVNIDGVTLTNSGNTLIIKDLGVSTLKIANNAVTVPSSAYTAFIINAAGTTSTTSWNETTVQTVVLNVTDANSVDIDFVANMAIEGTGYHRYRIYRGSTSIWEWNNETSLGAGFFPNQQGAGALPISIKDNSPGSGNVTYTMRYAAKNSGSGAQGCDFSHRFMRANATKK